MSASSKITASRLQKKFSAIHDSISLLDDGINASAYLLEHLPSEVGMNVLEDLQACLSTLGSDINDVEELYWQTKEQGKDNYTLIASVPVPPKRSEKADIKMENLLFDIGYYETDNAGLDRIGSLSREEIASAIKTLGEDISLRLDALASIQYSDPWKPLSESLCRIGSLWRDFQQRIGPYL